MGAFRTSKRRVAATGVEGNDSDTTAADFGARQGSPSTGHNIRFAMCLTANGERITYFVNGVAAYSLLIGGLISVLPNAYFARQAFRYAGAAYAREVTRAF